MVAGRTAGSAARLVSPVAHGAALVPSVVLAVWATSYLTSHVFIRSDFYEWWAWPLVVALPGAVVGGLAFAGVCRATLALERLARPAPRDHLRRSALLYAALSFLVFWLVASYSPAGSNYAFAFQIQLLSVVFPAIAVDALILKRRSNDAGGKP